MRPHWCLRLHWGIYPTYINNFKENDFIQPLDSLTVAVTSAVLTKNKELRLYLQL